MATGGSTDAPAPFFSTGEEYVTIGDAKAAEFFSYFSTLRENKCVSDFTITCRGQQFSVHRAILMANSDHYRQMFCRESPATCSCTVDADPCLVESVITYLYTGQLRVAKPRLHDVEEIAIGLQIVKLVAECARMRLSELVPVEENCLEMWRVGEAVGDQAMVDRSKRVALENFVSVQDTPAFLDLPCTWLSRLVLSEGIVITSCSERLLAVLEWVRHDPSRHQHLVPLLRALPLADMDRAFLRQCIHDVCLKTDAVAKRILNEVIAAKRADVAGVTDTRRTTRAVEQFISVAGLRSRRDKKWVSDGHVYLLPTSLTGPHKMLPDLPSSVPDSAIYTASACVIPETTGYTLLLSGVGRGRKDIFELDLGEVDGEWRQRGSLSHRRYRHDMVYVGGNVFVVGGDDPLTGSFVSAVEVMDVASGVCDLAGEVRGSTFSSTYCHVVRQTDLLVLVGQHPDHKATDLIQVYSTTRRQMTSTCQLPVGSTVHVDGMAVTDEQVIMCGKCGTYTCPLDALYHGDSTRIQKLSSRYTTPNVWCGVMLSEDCQSVLFIGGWNRTDKDTDTHPLYRGAVRDILDDTPTGLQQVPCSWPLKKAGVFSSGCCVVSIPRKRYRLPIQRISIIHHQS